MIVVDIGCKAYGPDDSLERLRLLHRPDVLFGFDPHPQLGEGVETFTRPAPCAVVTRRIAAWTYTGEIGWHADASRSRVNPLSSKTVPCFRLASFLRTLPRVDVLKMDAEGAEYNLIPDLLDEGLDAHVKVLLVEWHGDPINTLGAWDIQAWHEP